MYPAGIPEEQLRLLGPLSRQFSAQEIRQWQVTSSDTLYALLMNGIWSTAQVPALLGDTGGRLVAAKAVPEQGMGGGLQLARLPPRSVFLPQTHTTLGLCFPEGAAHRKVPGARGQINRPLASENRWELPV